MAGGTRSNVQLTGKEFIGTIIPIGSPREYDNVKMKGRYRVHVPVLMTHLEKDEGLMYKNHANKWRITPSDVGEYGSYFPLHPGTHVIVKFQENDLNAGYIDRIISDWKDGRDVLGQDCVDVKSAPTDRDEQYIIFKTPKKWSIFYVNEETEKEPNTIYLVYNRDNGPKRRTVFRIDESGLSFDTRDNRRVRIRMDDNQQVDGDQTELVKGYSTEHVDGDKDSHFHGYEVINIDGNLDRWTKGDACVEVSGSTTISNRGKIDRWSGSSINYDAPIINLNCGIASYVHSLDSKPNTSVRDLGPQETGEYDLADTVREDRPLVTGDKCDDVTDHYNNEKRAGESMDDNTGTVHTQSSAAEPVETYVPPIFEEEFPEFNDEGQKLYYYTDDDGNPYGIGTVKGGRSNMSFFDEE